MIPIENVRDLEIFQRVASKKSFSDAARSLGMTQPAVSLAIARLERQLGTTLFDRQNSGHANGFLTETGSILFTHATIVINELAGAVDIITDKEGRRPVRIGLPPFIARHFFPDGLYALAESYGAHPVEILGIGSRQLMEEIENHCVDVGMIASTGESLRLPRVRSSKVSTFPFMLAVPPSMVVPEDGINIADLKDMDCPFITFTGDFVQREALVTLFEQGGHTLNLAAETNQTEMMANLVRAGMGLGIASSIAFADDLEGVRLVPLVGNRAPHFNVFVFEDIARAVRPEAEVVTSIKRCLFGAVKQQGLKP